MTGDPTSAAAAMTYYLRQQARVSGPFTPQHLTALLRRGLVARSDKVSVDKATWITIADCAAIVARPVAAASPPAVVATPDDGVEWFYTVGGTDQPDAVASAALVQLIAAGTVGRKELVWREGFSDWRPVTEVEPFAAAFGVAEAAAESFLPAEDARTSHAGGPDYEAFVGNRVPAAVLAMVCGVFGIHKFVLGLNTGGTTMLVGFLSIPAAVLVALLTKGYAQLPIVPIVLIPLAMLVTVGLVEGLIYLTKSDDVFYRDYAVRKKQWF